MIVKKVSLSKKIPFAVGFGHIAQRTNFPKGFRLTGCSEFVSHERRLRRMKVGLRWLRAQGLRKHYHAIPPLVFGQSLIDSRSQNFRRSAAASEDLLMSDRPSPARIQG